MKLIIPGRCVPYVRARRGQKYTDPKASAYFTYKEDVAWRARRVIADLFEGDVYLFVAVYLKPGDERYGDADNYFKSICDALQGVAYANDKCVSDGGFMRRFELPERVEIEIKAVGA